MEPGRKMDFQTCVSRTLSKTSIGFGGLSLTGSGSPSPYALLDVRVLLLGHRDRAHRAAAPLSLRQARIVQAITGTTLDAHRASGARVVVDHEDGERALGLVPDGLGLGVLHDPRIEHVDAVPRADVLARTAQDARFGIEHEVLRRLHALLQSRGVPRLQRVVRVDVDFGLVERSHQRYPPVRCSPPVPRSLFRACWMKNAAPRITVNDPTMTPVAMRSRSLRSQNVRHLRFWSAKYSHHDGMNTVNVSVMNAMTMEATTALVQVHSQAFRNA